MIARLPPGIRLFLILGAMAAVAFGSFGPLGGAPSALGHVRDIHEVGVANSIYQGTSKRTSTTWAGYAVKAAGVTDVQGTWKVPTAKSCSSGNGFSAFWDGIDGYGSSTVEQTGTAVDCSVGSALYSAWYEFYPAAPVTLSWVVHPGDTMVGEVKASGSSFTVTLKDVTGALSLSITKSVKPAKRISAEWIPEAPTGSSRILPLTDFGSVTFTNATATILGGTHSIGGFNNIALTMWNVSHTQVKAKAGSLQSSGGHFAVAWKSAGP